MTAAALLVVLGSAYAMQLGGLSMAMGAFLAGVLLSESTYRHQLEVDVEPFRGILLGLFFLAVGMSLQLDVVAANWQMILFYVFAYMLVKGVAVYAVARMFRSSGREAVDRAVFMAQGGEFAFVLYAAATTAGIITAEQNAILTAIIIVSMVVTPLAIAGLNFVRSRVRPSSEGYERPNGLSSSALVIGFGRVGTDREPVSAHPRLRHLDHRHRCRDDRHRQDSSTSRCTTGTARASTFFTQQGQGVRRLCSSASTESTTPRASRSC